MQLPEEAGVAEAVPQLDDEAADQRRQLQRKKKNHQCDGGVTRGQLDEAVEREAHID